jgi:hypothetical protein
MAERITGEQALLNAVARQRDEAMNSAAKAQAQAEIALADNDALRARIDEMQDLIEKTKQLVEELKAMNRSRTDGHQIVDGASPRPDDGEPGHADDAGV